MLNTFSLALIIWKAAIKTCAQEINGGAGDELGEGRRAEQFPHLWNYTLTPDYYCYYMYYYCYYYYYRATTTCNVVFLAVVGVVVDSRLFCGELLFSRVELSDAVRWDATQSSQVHRQRTLRLRAQAGLHETRSALHCRTANQQC